MSDLFPYKLNVIGREAETLAGPLRAEAAQYGAAGEIDWLMEGFAFDIACGGDPQLVCAAARRLADGAGADINVVPVAHRKKRLLVADMDSTIITSECLDELADMAGLRAEISAITERAMRGELAFEPALRARVAKLAGLRLDALETVMHERVRLTAGARALVMTMRRHGAYTMLVSGGFTFFTQRVAEQAGFHEHHANHLLDDGTYLTGQVAEPIQGREAKLRALELGCAAQGFDCADALCVGDGANDLAMIARAGLGVAFHAKPLVAEAASARIDHGDLTALLYLQGYRAGEIVKA